MSKIIRLTTGDLWDDEAGVPVGGPNPPVEEVPKDVRQTAEYIRQYAEPMPVLRAVRLKCSACMGGEPDQMPRGEVARAIDECGSTPCPLWPFRYGRNPFRAPRSNAQQSAARNNLTRQPETDGAEADENER